MTRKLNASVLALAWALAASELCWAGQVPAPINAPATATQGDALTAGANPQQAADSGVSLSSQSANTVLAGPSSGGAAAPAFRSLVPADLPIAGTSTIGGIKAKASTSHQWVNGITPATGVVTASQPDCADLTTAAAHCGTNASEITSGTVPAANGGAGTINGALKGNGSGVVSKAASSDLSDATPTTSFTPTISFVTPGDLSVAYTTQVGKYAKVGNLVCAYYNIGATPTYTTASGNFQISVPPVAPADGTVWAGSVRNIGSLAWPGATDTTVLAAVDPTAIVLQGMKSGATPANFTTTQVPSGTALTIRLSTCFLA